MKIGIIGAGYIGRALAELGSGAGHEVLISNSRGPDTLSSIAVATGAKSATVEEAARFGELVVIAIPFKNRDQLGALDLAGKVVADANNYYPERDGQIVALDEHQTTTSEMTASVLPGAKIVKAFNAILAKDLDRDGKPAGAAGRRALPIAGDDADAKRLVAAFHDSIGYDVFDAGPLAEGWRFERAKPAYCMPLDRDDLSAALAAAERDVEVEHGSWRR